MKQGLTDVRAAAHALGKAFAALVFPQRNVCHLCGRELAAAGEGYLCECCANALNNGRISHYELALDSFPPLALCVAAYWHQDEARKLVHRLKYQSDRALAETLGEGMSAAYTTAKERYGLRADTLVAAPTAKRRIDKRGFNQAELLAREVGFHTGLQICEGVLTRRGQGSQVSLGRKDRLQAMRGVIAAVPLPEIVGRRVLLVDDVLTTGATATACAEALLGVGAAEVSLITACRA